MSFFKDRKIKKLGDAFGQHMQWLDKLTRLRLGVLKDAQETGLSPYHKGKILTWNYEMASHAGRALNIVRESEEIMGLGFSEMARNHRKSLIEYVDLPAFAVREWDTVGEPKIERLWQEFVVYEHTKNDEEQTILATLAGPTRVNSEEFARVNKVTGTEFAKVMFHMASSMAFKPDDGVANDILSTLGSEIEDSFQFRTEVLAFCLFPFDLIAYNEVEGYNESAHALTIDVCVEALKLSYDNPHASDVNWDRLPDFINTRLVQYAAALGTTLTEQRVNELARLGAGNISQCEPHIIVEMHLRLHFMSVMKHMRPPMQGYCIVTG